VKFAILLGNRSLWPHHYHFLAKLRKCASVVGALSLERAKGMTRVLRKYGLWKTLEIPAVVLRGLRYKRLRLAREKAFAEDSRALDGMEIVDVPDMETAAKVALDWNAQALFQFTAGIIRQPLLGATPQGVLSFHHGIMPLLRGLDSPFWAVYLDRPDCLGITLQRLDEKLDAGIILAQRQVSIKKNDSFEDIVVRLDRAGGETIAPMVAQLETRREWVAPPPGQWFYLSSPKLIHELTFRQRLRRFCRKYGA